VNGLDIYTPQEALQAYQQLQTESTVRLNILRNNSPTTLTYEIR
jgi:type II secretory pathway component PulC